MTTMTRTETAEFCHIQLTGEAAQLRASVRAGRETEDSIVAWLVSGAESLGEGDLDEGEARRQVRDWLAR